MKNLIKILISTCVLCVSVFAQTQTDEYKKNEFYGGYSHQQIHTGGYSPSNGFEAAYVRNVHRYLGIKVDFSASFRGSDFQLTQVDNQNGTYTYRGSVDSQVYNILGGVQFKNNASKGRFKPFGHILAGVAVERFKGSTLTCVQGNCPAFVSGATGGSSSRAYFAMAGGGGLDIRINDKIDFRAIQVDYNPIFHGSGVQSNFRFGIGVVFK